MGLKPDEFWGLTFGELALMRQAKENASLEEWRRWRWLGTIYVNLHRDKKKGAMIPERLLPLPGDKGFTREPEYMTKERFLYYANKWPRTKVKK